MQGTLRDLRFGARALRKSPGFAIVAVVALAVGIGLTTTMFSIVYGALLKGLSVPEGDRVVTIERTNRLTSDRNNAFPIHEYADLVAQQRSFETLAAYYNGTVNVSGTERAERFDGAFVTPNLFRVLRVNPVLGRTFTDDEVGATGARVAILAHDVWQDRFGGRPDVIGATLRANGVPHTVVGVMPEGFAFPETEQIWLPLPLDPLAIPRGEGQWTTLVGRLAPGVTPDRASLDVAAVMRRLESEHEETNEGITAHVLPFTEAFIGPEPRAMLWTMLGAVFLVLLIACTNVANLLLGRAAHRAKEVSVRTALGASRWAVIRQFLVEAFVLAGTATLLAVVIAWVGIDLFNRAIVDTQPPYWIDIALHPPVLLFSAGLALVSTLMAGILPALQASRPNLHDVLKDESRGSSGLRIGRTSRALVTFEIALSCGLLVAAGLMVKSVINLRTIDYGFRSENVFTARLGFPSTFTDTAAQARFFRDLEARLAALPGAQRVALSSSLPGTGAGRGPVAIEGKSYATERDQPRAGDFTVTPGFFGLYEVAARTGRLLEPTDRGESSPVAVVNEAFVRDHLGGGEAVGQRIRLGGPRSTAPWLTIVGVVPDLHSGQPDVPYPPMIYRPLAQNHTRFMSIAIATQGTPLALTAGVRDVVASLDRDIALYWVFEMREALARPNWAYNVFGSLFMIFGVVALFLAAVGLYAVMAFAVGRRTRELGIRMALGARAGDVVRLILRQGAWQLGIGMLGGLALAAGVGQLLQVILFDVEPRDPVIFATVAALLGAAGVLACLIPARRATRVDPLTALRSD